MVKKKAALGKGLGALIENADEINKKSSGISINEIRLELIEVNPYQPRTFFDEEALQELADSIREIGIVQPLTLRKLGDDRYQIIAGERRFRASKLAALKKVPAYVRDVDDELMLEMALVENIQREDLDAIEVALSYNQLIEEFKLTQDELSNRVGKKRTTVTNYLRLLKLPAEIQLGIKERRIQMGHARALLGVEDPSTQLMIYEQVLKYEFSVRKVEEIVKELKAEGDKTEQPSKQSLGKEYQVLKTHLSSFFGVKVGLQRKTKGNGHITIPFTSDDELERIISILDKLE